MYGKSSCEMSGPYVCGMVGGKPKASFCEAGGNFCPYIMMQTIQPTVYRPLQITHPGTQTQATHLMELSRLQQLQIPLS